MKIFKYVLITIAAIVVIFLVLGLFAPKEYKVERSITINAPQQVVMDQVKSLKNMQEWSPWAEQDPDMKITYEGTDGEVGSVSKWEGDKMGQGMQEVTAISENRVETKLTFIEPWESECTAYFQLDPEGEAVKVTWVMEGQNSFPWNALSLLMSMDKMIGKDFEKGLEKLKTRCEGMAAEAGNEEKTYRGYAIHEMNMEPKLYIAKRDKVAFDKIGEFYETHLPAIFEAAGKAGLQPAGSPCGLFYKWDQENKTADMAAAVPVIGDNKTKVKGYENMEVAGGKALHIAYYGAYEKSEDAHYAMDDYMKEKGLELNELVIEEYVTDPTKEADTSKWLTNIYYLVK